MEPLFTIMGPGCVSVTRVYTEGSDMAIGIWEGGRIGSVRGIRDGRRGYGSTVFGTKGIVPGGGITLLRTTKAVEKLKLVGDEEIGQKIILRALEEPIRQIATNAGFDGSVVAEKAKKEPETTGFDAAKLEWIDMFKAGIIDPAKVVRSELQNAASVSALLLTTETIVTDIPEKKEPVPPMPPGGGGMGGMGGMY